MDIYSVDFFIAILIDLILTILGYCTIPIILRITKGKMEYEKGRKIILINCIVVWFIFALIKIGNGLDAKSGAVFLYYFIDKAILLKPKEDEEEIKKEDNKKENYSLSFANETEIRDRSNSFNVYGEDIKLEKTVEQKEEKQLNNLIEKLEEEKVAEPKEERKIESVKKAEEHIEKKGDKTTLYIILIGVLAVVLIGVGIYAFNLSSMYESRIDDLNTQLTTLKNNYRELETEKNTEWLENIRNSAKIEFFDENIVFVIDGYGNYYYTYDQMEQVTQGIDEYSYWAYNKEQAISRGYRAWK